MSRPIVWALVAVLLGYVIYRLHLWWNGLAALLVLAFICWVFYGAAILSGKSVYVERRKRPAPSSDAEMRKAAQQADAREESKG